MRLRVDKNTNLELINLSHANELFKLTDANRRFLKKWLPWVDHTNTVDDTKNFISRTRKNTDGNNGLQFAIKYKGKIAGMIGLVEISRVRSKTEIGYWLAEEYNGKGIMTKACKTLVDYCFKNLKLRHVIIGCDVKNKPSRRIPERLGFFKQGILKRDGFAGGKFADHAIYSMRKMEWDEQRKK